MGKQKNDQNGRSFRELKKRNFYQIFVRIITKMKAILRRRLVFF